MMGRMSNIKRPSFLPSQKCTIDFAVIRLWGLFWSVIFCLIRLFSSLAAPSARGFHCRLRRVLNFLLVLVEWQSVSEIRKNLSEIPLRLLLDTFPFMLTECATLSRAWNASVWSHCLLYSLFEHIISFPHNCILTKTFICRKIFANTVNYLVLLESCSSHVAKGTSTEGQIFIFDLQSLQNTWWWIILSVMQLFVQHRYNSQDSLKYSSK